MSAAWKWYGRPGHFYGAFDCRFHLCTEVGGVLVSTVGEWLPDDPIREAIAKARGVKLRGYGDDRRYDYLAEIGFSEIANGYKYETMAFCTTGERCVSPECGCGMPVVNLQQLECVGANAAKTATENHLRLCAKYNEEASP